MATKVHTCALEELQDVDNGALTAFSSCESASQLSGQAGTDLVLVSAPQKRGPFKPEGGTTASMLLYLALFSAVLGSCTARELSTRSGPEGLSSLADSGLNVKVTIDVSKTHAVAPNLWGIFFEEVRAAGTPLYC